MTPSIIRRFAKYHGIDVTAVAMAPTAPWGGIANLASAIYGSCHTEHVAKVIQTITRMEDAEMLLGDADGLEMEIGPAGRFTTFDEHGARVLTAAANRLFAKAGIDPAKWREVKE